MSLDDHKSDGPISAGKIAFNLEQAVDLQRLSCEQQARLWDAVGLLGAINEGILRSDPRIFSDLLEIVAQLEDNPDNEPVLRSCHEAVLRCAEGGFSASPDSLVDRERMWVDRAVKTTNDLSGPGIS